MTKSVSFLYFECDPQGQLGADALSVLLDYLLTSEEYSKDPAATQSLVTALREVHQGLLSEPITSAHTHQGSSAQQLPLTLTPLFAEHAGEMNFLNSSNAAMNLQSDLAALLGSMGGGGACMSASISYAAFVLHTDGRQCMSQIRIASCSTRSVWEPGY